MAKRTTKAHKAPDGPDLSYITADLRPLCVPIGDLVADPANPVKHGSKNLAAIRGSLAQYGQRVPIVVQSAGMIVRKGNGVVEAARQLGWTHIARVLVDDDNITAVGFSIADNRAGDLHEWDVDAMTQLMREVTSSNDDLSQTLEDLAEQLKIVVVPVDAPASDDSQPPDPEPPVKLQVLVTCPDEPAQAELLERLTKEGFDCSKLTA